MPLRSGSNQPTKLYLGAAEVQKIYLGSTAVYTTQSEEGGGDGGTISITLDRTTLQCAPDSVRFSLDLSEASFDLSAPSGSQIYDQRQHDWVVLWDFGDASDSVWSAPENILSGWNDRNTYMGWDAVHMYRAPGDYDVSVWVYEPSSGKTASASVTVTVLGADAVYPDARTVCISTSGNFADAPAGAVQVTAAQLKSGDSAWTSNVHGSLPTRFLFCGGESFETDLWVGAVGNGIMFGAYGVGRATLTGEGNGSVATIYVNSDYAPGVTLPEIRVSQLDIVGNNDPTTDNSSTDQNTRDRQAVRYYRTMFAMFSECVFDGHLHGALGISSPDESEARRIHLDDCAFSNFGGHINGQYPMLVYANYQPSSYVAVTGSRLAANPNTLNDSGFRAPIRAQGSNLLIIDGCDFFHTTSTQPCIKIEETPEQDGAQVQVSRSSFEGGIWQISFGNNVAQSLNRSFAVNAVIQNCVLVANYATQYSLQTNASGVTMRNLLIVLPGLSGANAWSYGASGIRVSPSGTFSTEVAAAPVRTYNVTLRNERTTAENGGLSTDVMSYYRWGATDFDTVETDNNLNHSPNLNTPLTASGPVSNVQLFTPRTIGDRDASTQVLDTTLSSDAVVYDTKPKAGSAALGAAVLGNVAYDDISETGDIVRGDAAGVDAGAWQVTN